MPDFHFCDIIFMNDLSGSELLLIYGFKFHKLVTFTKFMYLEKAKYIVPRVNNPLFTLEIVCIRDI